MFGYQKAILTNINMPFCTCTTETYDAEIHGTNKLGVDEIASKLMSEKNRGNSL
jgi:hypothetical protein